MSTPSCPIPRRTFLKQAGAAVSLAMVQKWAHAATPSDRLGALLPLRQLTRDGTKVTAFTLGGWHVGVSNNPQDAEVLIDKAIEAGVRFFDNARGYHNGRSEEYYGKFLTPKYRKEIFLMTKSPAKTGEKVREDLEASLQTMKTDHLDLWQIHNILTPEDVDGRIRDGVLDAFLEAKASGKTRYIGFTGHRNPATHLHFLKRLDELGVVMDTCMLPLNICDPSFESFQLQVLPVLLEKGYGVIAMKTMAGGSMLGARIDTTPKKIRTEEIPDVLSKTGISPASLHQYVYSLPVSTLCSGCRNTGELERNIRVLAELKNMSESEQKFLIEAARPYAGGTVENYKRVLKG